MVKTAIVNVVATASVDQKLDFEKLRKFKEIFHDSNVYGGRVAYFKTAFMEGRVSIFASGKMISVGTKSERKAFCELKSTMKFLVDKGFVRPVKLQPKVHNIVVSVDFGRDINLEELAENTKILYEPEQFPGAMIKLFRPFKASVLLFASGKAVIAGLKNSSEIEPTVKRIAASTKISII
jgi:TATA-box binding protein (TBP) (component of TFIID and TFIIIB)